MHINRYIIISMFILFLLTFSGCIANYEHIAEQIVDKITLNKKAYKNKRIAIADIKIHSISKSTEETMLLTDTLNSSLAK